MSEEKLEMANKNPKRALDAICVPGELTMAKIALLERIKSPVMYGKTEDSVKNLVAVYAITSKNPGLVLRQFMSDELESAALEWGDQLAPMEFAELFAKTLDSISAFWQMLPRPEGDETNEGGKTKKDSASETVSSPN